MKSWFELESKAEKINAVLMKSNYGMREFSLNE